MRANKKKMLIFAKTIAQKYPDFRKNKISFMQDKENNLVTIIVNTPVMSRIRIQWIHNWFASWIRIHKFWITDPDPVPDPCYLSKG